MNKYTESIEFLRANVSTYKYDEESNVFKLKDDVEDHGLIFTDIGIITSILEKNKIGHTIDELNYSIKID